MDTVCPIGVVHSIPRAAVLPQPLGRDHRGRGRNTMNVNALHSLGTKHSSTTARLLFAASTRFSTVDQATTNELVNKAVLLSRKLYAKICRRCTGGRVLGDVLVLSQHFQIWGVAQYSRDRRHHVGNSHQTSPTHLLPIVPREFTKGVRHHILCLPL